jgi:hypothetical protein
MSRKVNPFLRHSFIYFFIIILIHKINNKESSFTFISNLKDKKTWTFQRERKWKKRWQAIKRFLNLLQLPGVTCIRDGAAGVVLTTEQAKYIPVSYFCRSSHAMGSNLHLPGGYWFVLGCFFPYFSSLLICMKPSVIAYIQMACTSDLSTILSG